MWDLLGFKENPYSTKPLGVSSDDVPLLIGRNSEINSVFTSLTSARDGVLVISGAPGVGKTSFFNIVQYLTESKKNTFGLEILAARERCAVQTDDTPKDIALLALNTLCRKARDYCDQRNRYVPENIAKVSDWLSSISSTGLSLTFSAFGFGAGGRANNNS